MRTHDDNSHDPEKFKSKFMDELEKRAKEMSGKSKITAGAEGEDVVAQWITSGMHVTIRPDDPQNIVRISIGGGKTPVPLNYCVLRGDVAEALRLLELAITALRSRPRR